MIELRSDTFTQPTQEMRNAIYSAEVGDDVYSEDPTVLRLEQLAADMLGKEAAILMPSGTMANLACLLTHCPRGTKAIVGRESDIFLYEAGGATQVGSIIYDPQIDTNGHISLDDILKSFPEDLEDPQFAIPSVICVENTHNRSGGRVLPTSYLEELRKLADLKEIPIHMDGARIFNAATYLEIPVSAIAKYADSIQFCLSKGLSAPVGSMVVGSQEFIHKVRRTRKMLGGGMRQAGIIAAAGAVALQTMIERLREDHMNAQTLANGIKQISGLSLISDKIDTNIVLFTSTLPHISNSSVVQSCASLGLNLSEFGQGRIRAVTHSGVNKVDINRAINILSSVVTA